MRCRYVIIPGVELAGRLRQMLLAEGVDEKEMEMFASRRYRSSASSIPLKRFRPTPLRLLLSGLAGCAVLLAISWMLSFDTGFALMDGVGLSLTIATGFVLGAVIAFSSGPSRKLKRLKQEMNDDDILLVMDSPDRLYNGLAQKIMAEHPEIRMLGSDPAGSPPFP